VAWPASSREEAPTQREVLALESSRFPIGLPPSVGAGSFESRATIAAAFPSGWG